MKNKMSFSGKPAQSRAERGVRSAAFGDVLSSTNISYLELPAKFLLLRRMGYSVPTVSSVHFNLIQFSLEEDS